MNPLTSLIGRLPSSVSAVLPPDYLNVSSLHSWNLGAGQEIHVARMPEPSMETASALGHNTLFLSGDGRNFHQLRVGSATPQALLTATPRFIPMAFATEGAGMRLLCNLPGDSERLVDLLASQRHTGELLQDAAFYLFSKSEETPAPEGALRRWWAENVENPPPGRERIDAATFTEFVHGLGHAINNANAVIAYNAQGDDADSDKLLPDILASSNRIGRLMHRLQQRFHGSTGPLPDPLAVLDEHERQEVILREWAAAATEPASPVSLKLPASKTSPLLVIEDDEDLGEIAVMSLQSRGFSNIRLARTPDEAMEIFERFPALSAVLSDFNLKADLTGLDLAREMRRRRPGVQVLIVTGQAEQVYGMMTDDERREIEVLHKPTDGDVLEKRLRRLLNPS